MFARICLSVNVLLAFYAYNKHNTILAPTFILNAMWGLANLMNVLLGWNDNEIEYLILMLPPLMFSIGFEAVQICYLNSSNRCVKTNMSFENTGFVFKESTLMVMYGADLALSAVYFVFILTNIRKYYTGSLWYTLRLITWLEEDASSALLKYPVVPIFILPTLFIYQYRMTKRKKGRIVVSILIALLWGFFYSSRTPIFTFVVLTIFAQMICSIRPSVKEQRKHRRLIVVSVVFFLVVFIYQALKKNGTLYGDVSMSTFIIKSLINYTNLSLACFVEWVKRPIEYLGGKITFRFLYAVLEKVGLEFKAINSSSGGLFINYNGFTTNAFTVARNYVEDFGVAFMAIMLFIFGLFHGYLYKKATKSPIGPKKIRYIIMCSALYVPLFYQIMTDQYMNCFSQWLQYFLWSYVMTSSLFVQKTMWYEGVFNGSYTISIRK